MGATRPQRLGGVVAVTDSDALADLDARGFPPGTRVFNADVGDFFKLTTSDEALDPDSVVAVKDTDGARWIINPGGGGGGGGGFDTLAATMAEAVPALTSFNGFGPDAVFPNGNPTANFQSVDAKQAGGAITAGNTKMATLCSAVVFNDLTGVSWAVGMYGSLAVSTDGSFNLLGLVGDTSLYGVATLSTEDATHYLLYTFKQGGGGDAEPSTVVCDGEKHYFVLAFDVDAGTLTLFIDGVEAASTTTLTQLHNADVYLGLYNDVSGDAVANLGGVGF